jgi:hypothetical protein
MAAAQHHLIACAVDTFFFVFVFFGDYSCLSHGKCNAQVLKNLQAVCLKALLPCLAQGQGARVAFYKSLKETGVSLHGSRGEVSILHLPATLGTTRQSILIGVCLRHLVCAMCIILPEEFKAPTWLWGGAKSSPQKRKGVHVSHLFKLWHSWTRQSRANFGFQHKALARMR